LASGQPYTAPGSRQHHRFINIKHHHLNITAPALNQFINDDAGESGNSAGSSGTAPLLGGAGMNVFSSGTWTDSFLLAYRGLAASTAGTVGQFHQSQDAGLGVAAAAVGLEQRESHALAWPSGYGST
jgi:hypothetical protein